VFLLLTYILYVLNMVSKTFGATSDEMYLIAFYL